ncbi:MAG TPA: hypothetical protein VNZ06_04490 [Steroidobacteraceae bacterium]|jgi:hypothetical protein|nr:hypothetical protein [Steroidobacteraceae bacterium]
MIDAELDSWKREWRERTDPFPALKRKISRQNLKTGAAIVVLLLLMALSLAGALHYATAFMYGAVVGVWTLVPILGGYVWWVARGAWKATAQTTVAYAELAHRRAVARARTLRFGLIYLLVAWVLGAGVLAWDWRHFSTSLALVLLGLLIELLVFRYYLQPRRQRQIEEAAKLVDYIRELTRSET